MYRDNFQAWHIPLRPDGVGRSWRSLPPSATHARWLASTRGAACPSFHAQANVIKCLTTLNCFVIIYVLIRRSVRPQPVPRVAGIAACADKSERVGPSCAV